MGWLDLAAAGTSLIGDGVGAWLNHEEAQNAQAFSERMASTQYQRAAKDLSAAGLNRILALGNPSSAPTAAAASVPSIGQGAAGAFSSVHSARAGADLAREQAKLPEKQVTLLENQASEAFSRDQLNKDQAAFVATQQQHEVDKDLVTREQLLLTQAQTKEANATARSAEAEAAFNEMLYGGARALGPAAVLGAKGLDIIFNGKGAYRAGGRR